MHYHLEVHLQDSENIDDQIEALLAPYDENLQVASYEEDGETYWDNPDGLYDWYQIGGRWTGAHDAYDPANDPANARTCSMCNGTGKRADMEVINGCNVCNGTGTEVLWPTDWKRHDGDVAPVASIPDDMTASHMLINGNVIQLEEGETVKQALAQHNVKDGYLVTVDFHC